MQRFCIEWWWVFPLALVIIGFLLLPKSGKSGDALVSNTCWALAAGIFIGHLLC